MDDQSNTGYKATKFYAEFAPVNIKASTAISGVEQLKSEIDIQKRDEYYGVYEKSGNNIKLTFGDVESGVEGESKKTITVNVTSGLDLVTDVNKKLLVERVFEYNIFVLTRTDGARLVLDAQNKTVKVAKALIG